MTTYSNGELTMDKDTGHAFVSDSELLQQDPGLSTCGVGGTVACVATTLGVSGGAAHLIATVCAGACVTPATGFSAAVCAACIGGYATMGGASIAAAASCF
ncbi:MAG: hypothetical protein L0G94_03470 [Brachybacterium sp.]|uniref:hypothetical protein n=1 Tax=Brachybacterium sp. TaxID=1891286 RepID=UPI002648EA66|nr:hypothetical protein [Brachybacterium sp.]MDN5685730.1 hypothetical protein [Brachybacterium sp.]